MSLLFLLALAIPTASAPHEWADPGDPVEVTYTTLPPVYNAVDGDNITMTLRGLVSSMGNHTLLTVTFAVFYTDFTTWWPSNPGWWNVTGDDFNVPLNPLTTTDVSLEQGQTFDVKFLLCLDPPDCTFTLWEDAKTVRFTVPTAEEFYLAVHPLTVPIQSLGIPVNITLGIIGLVILLIPLAIVTLTTGFPRNQELLPILMVGLSANIFLRFWPAVLIIFVGIFCGWMIMDFIPKGGAGDNSR